MAGRTPTARIRRKLAEGVIAAQEAEIKQMQDWLLLIQK